jgi:hypothetical protein
MVKRVTNDKRRKQRKSRIATVGTSGSSTLLPDHFKTRLVYSELIGLNYTGSTGSTGYNQYRCNSIYDPNFTGTGHQPLGHDQWNLFYNRYRVTGMSYVVTFTNISATEECEVALELRPNSTVNTVMDTIREGPNCVYKSLCGASGASNATRTARGFADIAKIRGISKQRVLIESDFQAVFGNNPPIEVFLNIHIINQDALTSVGMRVRVDLTYHVDLFDRKIQTQS